MQDPKDAASQDMGAPQESGGRDSGRTVVITGAGGGIGRVLVESFRANGDFVVAVDLHRDSLAQYREDAGILSVATDISDDGDCDLLARAVTGSRGHVDILVHCAGLMPISPFEQISPSEWRRCIDINLTGPFFVTRAILPLMTHRGWGRLIFISSGTIFHAPPNQAHYIAAKSGIVGLARSLATELGGRGITSNVITPGLTLTETILRSFEKDDLLMRRTGRAIKRDMHPADLVGAVRFLASTGADFMTGQILNVDGGNNKH